MAARAAVDGSHPPPLRFPSWSERPHSRLGRTGERSPEIDPTNCEPQRPRNQQSGRQIPRSNSPDDKTSDRCDDTVTTQKSGAARRLGPRLVFHRNAHDLKSSGAKCPRRDRQKVHDPRSPCEGKPKGRAPRHPVRDPPGDACRWISDGRAAHWSTSALARRRCSRAERPRSILR